MKSRTSSCKTAAFKKNLSRFWPVWAGYILCLVIVQLTISNDDLTYWYAANMGESIAIMGFVNAVYALVAAQTLFGDLFNSRMCFGLHSLPLKRQEWFDVHITAGFLFSLVPTALMAGFSEIIISLYSVMEKGWQLPLYWFAAVNLQYVFFFGLAVFCCVCAGSRLGGTIIYGILNSFSLLLYLMVSQLYTPLLFGVVTSSTLFEMLCPVMWIASTRCIDADRLATGNMITHAPGIEEREYIGIFEVTPEGWKYIGILVLIGILLLVLGRIIYKKRHLECAGDLLSARWLEGPFQIVFTILCAAGMHGLFLFFFGLNADYVYVLPAVGLTAGWFAGRMFLERTTRVFRLKNFIGFGLISVLMVLSLFVTHLDPLGIDDWVPQTEELNHASIGMNYNAGCDSEDPQVISDMIRLQELALQQHITVHPDYDPYYYNPNTQDPQAVRITFSYTLKNGWIAQRQYYILADGESGQIMRKYFSTLESVIAREEVKDLDDLRHELKDADRITLYGRAIPEKYMTEEFRMALADAIAADCETGNMVQSGIFHPEILLDFEDDVFDTYAMNLDISGLDFWCYLDIYADCENILAVLEPTGILDLVRADYETTMVK